MERQSFHHPLQTSKKKNPFQNKSNILFRNIRRTGNPSPPLLTRPSPTNVLSCTSHPSTNLVHHRGAYYTILRPTSRRTEVC